MASSVVVLYNARRYVVKVNPSTIVQHVVKEACQRIGLQDAEAYGLQSDFWPLLLTARHGSSFIDLSLPVRLTNLTNGAKLQLVIKPKGRKNVPSTITVALHNNHTSNRSTGKCESEWSLYDILKYFAVQAGKDSVIEQSSDGLVGYPVLQVMNNEYYGSKLGTTTLKSLGIKDNVLIRMSYKEVEQDSDVLKEYESLISTIDIHENKEMSDVPVADTPAVIHAKDLDDRHSAELPETIQIPQQDSPCLADRSDPVIRPLNRNSRVYNPVSASTPLAATLSTTDEDYEMTTDQARIYQSMLTTKSQKLSQGRELLTQTQRKEREDAKRAKVIKCEIKFKFPDSSQMIGTFSGAETGDVLSFLKAHMRYPNEPFHLCECEQDIESLIIALPRTNVVLTNYNATLSDDLAFSSRMLLLFSWQSSASEEAVKALVLSDDTLKSGIDISAQVATLVVETPITEIGVTGEDARVSKLKNNTTGTSTKKFPSWLKLKK